MKNKKLNKELVFTITTIQRFPVDEEFSSGDIGEIMERLREMGTAEIVDVRLEDVEEIK